MGVKITNEMITAAQKAQADYGIPASITLAQITLESGGNYEGGLSALAYNYNNLFGQKAGKSEAGVTLGTAEHNGSGYYQTSAKFRVYDSFEESIMEHGQKWGTSRVGQHDSLEGYANALVSKGYATDPKYVSKLMSIIERDELAQYDTLSSAGVTELTYETIQTGTMAEKIETQAKEIASPVLSFILLAIIGVLAVVFLVKAITGTNILERRKKDDKPSKPGNGDK